MSVLTFKHLDGVAFAAQRHGIGDVSASTGRLIAESLGPLVECHQLINDVRVSFPAVRLQLDGVDGFVGALAGGGSDWICQKTKAAGFFKMRAGRVEDHSRWTKFRVAAHKAGLSAGFPASAVAQLIGAMTEIFDNVFEHSGSPDTGVVAFKASPNRFEFSISDRGMGVLDSLRTCDEYATLTDCGTALELMLKEGVTRFGRRSKRGTGFRSLFIGLANLHGHLRFRSGDHVVVIDGLSPTLMNARLAQKVPVQGLVASIDCQLP